MCHDFLSYNKSQCVRRVAELWQSVCHDFLSYNKSQCVRWVADFQKRQGVKWVGELWQSQCVRRVLKEAVHHMTFWVCVRWVAVLWQRQCIIECAELQQMLFVIWLSKLQKSPYVWCVTYLGQLVHQINCRAATETMLHEFLHNNGFSVSDELPSYDSWCVT